MKRKIRINTKMFITVNVCKYKHSSIVVFFNIDNMQYYKNKYI